MAINLDRNPLQYFSRELSKIACIQLIQNDLEILEGAVGLERKKHYLNQTYIIHLVSQWQVFIEEIIKYGFRELLVKSNENNNMGSFAYAVEKNCEQQIKRFNTPNSNNIDKLFESILGIKAITDKFRWGTMTSHRATQILDEILQLRHKIAHTGISRMELDIEKNFKYMKHLYNLAYILQYTMDVEIGENSGKFEIPHCDNII